MYYVVDTPKSFSQAAQDLDAAVKRNNFGVLHVHDLGLTLRSKGIDFSDYQIPIVDTRNCLKERNKKYYSA